jgi:hypothetical protein
LGFIIHFTYKKKMKEKAQMTWTHCKIKASQCA